MLTHYDSVFKHVLKTSTQLFQLDSHQHAYPKVD